MNKKFIAMLFLMAPLALFAQKFGHLNSADIIQVMPEYATAQTELQNLEKQYTNEDFRFTYKNGYLYVFQMRPSKNIKIKTLRKQEYHDYFIESVSLLGSDEDIEFTRNEEYLEINLKAEPEGDLPLCFRMEIG